MTARLDEPAAVLAGLPMFRRAAPGARFAALAREARTLHAPRGGVIARRGERLGGVGVVARGLVKLSLRGDAEKVLRLAGPGDTFGEEALLLDRPLAVDVAALADTLVVMAPRKPLLRLLDSDPRLMRELLGLLSERVQSLVADFEATTLHGARERLAAYLASLASGGDATLPASKTVIAARLGMTKETLSRLLHRLADEGVIAVQRREIRVLDRERLSAAARG